SVTGLLIGAEQPPKYGDILRHPTGGDCEKRRTAIRAFFPWPATWQRVPSAGSAAAVPWRLQACGPDSTVRAAHAAHNGACYTTWSSCTATERCRPLRCSLRRHQPLKCWLWATAHPPCLATLVMTGISPCPMPAWPRSTIRFAFVPATRVQAPADST